MHAHTYKHIETLTHTHTSQSSALGLDPVRTIVELLPLLLLDGNCLWALYDSLCSVCVCVCCCACKRWVCLWVFACASQRAHVAQLCIPIPSHYTVGLFCCILPQICMCVTSPSILSPLCRSVTTAPASASDCLWWLTVTQPPFLLVCLSRYKSLMILCVFIFFFKCVCVCVCVFLCVFACIHTARDGSHYPHKGQFS